MSLFRRAAGLAVMAIAGSAWAAPGAPKVYIVQLADPPTGVYEGGVARLAATRPTAGRKLDATLPAVRNYVAYLSTRQNGVLAAVGGVPVHRYTMAFNGFAAALNDAQLKLLRQTAEVKSVVESSPLKLETTRTPAFLGLSTPGGLWSQLDAASRKIRGENIVIGLIDSGAWPEAASFGDKVNAAGEPVAYSQTGTPAYDAPLHWRGTCQTGPGFTPAMCNHKLIGARFYNADYFAQGNHLSSFEYLSPRDAQGHGSHTASTAGGNGNAPAVIDGASVGTMSGIAPRARLAVYKVCWKGTDEASTACFPADVIKAIDDAVADGVDVINYSISGSQTQAGDPVELAFLNATTAGVFVAASAGNNGPANTVAHISPWLTTVAASTHDRNTVSDVILGSGPRFSGPSYQTGGLSPTAVVLARDAGLLPFASLGAVDQTALQRCYNADDRAALGGSAMAALDPRKVAGKMVVCFRGANVLINKASAVKAAGGAAMLLQNVPALPPALPASNNSLILQPYVVPTVHLPVADYAAVASYASSAGATIGFTGAVQVPGTIAPVMADFSSRGPNAGLPDVLKPDLTAPGVDIIAAYVDTTLTQAQHDAVALGNLVPPSNANSIQGTSMSSPHVAGAAALLRQAHPDWTPSAIKSALMTSATDVKLASGALDPDRWGYGAGHLNPDGAAHPGLVYDITPSDYGKFACNRGLAPPPGLGTCDELGDGLTAGNLNLASVTASSVLRTRTLTRTVTNVTGAQATFIASASLPNWSVLVTPSSLSLAPGESKSFKVAMTALPGAVGSWTFGHLTWTGNGQAVRSPLSAQAIGFSAPAEVVDRRASGTGSRTYAVVSAYTGPMSVVPSGLVAARVDAGKVATNGSQCTNVVVAEGTQVARFQLFNDDTESSAVSNLDLSVIRGADGVGPVVGTSAGSDSNEKVTLMQPAAGTYSACVAGTATPAGGARYALSSWVVGPTAVADATLKAAAPYQVYENRSATFGLGWSVPAGKRYLGLVVYKEGSGSVLGASVVSVDNH